MSLDLRVRAGPVTRVQEDLPVITMLGRHADCEDIGRGDVDREGGAAEGGVLGRRHRHLR